MRKIFKSSNNLKTTILIIVIPVTDTQEKTYILTIKQKTDGSYEINWDKEDPMWSFMNHFTSAEIQVMIQQAIKEHLND